MEPGAFAFLLIGTSVFGFLCIGDISGWTHLAQRFPCGERKPERWASGCSVTVGRLGYNHCISMGSDQNGLYLRVAMPFISRLGHQPLYIPWSEISTAVEGKRLWEPTIDLKLRSCDVVIRVYPRELDENTKTQLATKIKATSDKPNVIK